MRQTDFFCHFRPFFAFLPPKQPKISRFWKNLKNAWRYYFTHVYHKLQSYDAWFLRYQVRRTEFFVILDIFSPIYPLKTRKIKISKKWKKCLEMSLFYTSVPKIMFICYTVPEIWCVTDVITFHFRPFFVLLPS